MKKLILVIGITISMLACKQQTESKNIKVRDGFYQVIVSKSNLSADNLSDAGQIVVAFDTLVTPREFNKVVIDTTDFVPLDLKKEPVTVQQIDNKKALSIELTASAAEKMKTFSANRFLKEAVIVVDGKVISKHKIRETISGPEIQITGDDASSYDYLCAKMKGKVK